MRIGESELSHSKATVLQDQDDEQEEKLTKPKKIKSNINLCIPPLKKTPKKDPKDPKKTRKGPRSMLSWYTSSPPGTASVAAMSEV